MALAETNDKEVLQPVGRLIPVLVVDELENGHRELDEDLFSGGRGIGVVCYQSFYENGVISIILEYMDGGSLADLLKKVKTIPESYLAAICKQVWSKQFPFSLVPIIIFTESLTRSDLFLFSFLTI